jgi:hypothetical protein
MYVKKDACGRPASSSSQQSCSVRKTYNLKSVRLQDNGQRFAYRRVVVQDEYLIVERRNDSVPPSRGVLGNPP